MLHRLLLDECRVGPGELRLEDADLLFGDPDTRGVVLQRCLLLANVVLPLLRPLHSAIAGLRQLGVALEILLRIDERRLIRSDQLAGLLDRLEASTTSPPSGRGQRARIRPSVARRAGSRNSAGRR